ncbi:MAG: TetR/AcrR family transcriptional regulator [Streptosporangiales bacterium]|nr:TetR/AcrR family transcriptional regulator [Streptosporangiales bacterium]
MVRRDEILDTASRLFALSGLRTSLQDIADACGIQPGSLYHHFDSKESIVIELLRRYHAELDRVAERARDQLKDLDPRQADRQIIRLGTDLAECAVRNSAAVQFTFYEPPAGASEDLARLAGRPPAAAEAAVLDTLRTARSGGVVRDGTDLEMLTSRLIHTMLHVALGLFDRYPAVRPVAGRLGAIMLHGVAAVPPSDGELDRSAALAAVDEVIRTWEVPGVSANGDRAELIRQAARAEFGRRGYEVTTVRDIAGAAGVSTGSVYRTIGSKEELLGTIMDAFSRKVVAGWSAALGSGATPVEKLDALVWLQINVLEQFNDEYKTQLAWMRQSPPDANTPGQPIPMVIRQVRSLLAEGSRDGQIRVDSPSAELTARCVIELSWMPERIIRDSGTRPALVHARDTLIRGVAA